MSNMNTTERVAIFDTTLRDGQQAPGAGMTHAQNLEYAEIAAALGVDVLEAGFPSASLGDFDMVHDIAKKLADLPHSPIVCGLSQSREPQVLRTIEALLPAQAGGRARVHIYLPVDPELMAASLGSLSTRYDDLIAEVSNLISIASQAGMEVEFSPEGYSRQQGNFEFTSNLIIEAVRSGARIINCPDTMGIGSTYQGDSFFVNLMNRHAEMVSREFPGIPVEWSTHNHNDLGLATTNSLLAVTDGPARQIECTINGVGERAGNTSLEQVVMNIFVHLRDRFHTGVATERLMNASDFISKHMMPKQANGPIVHENSFRHSSGGHTNAILSNPDAYHVFSPDLVGAKLRFCFGPLSGSNHAQNIITEAGYRCDENEKVEICQYIKDFHSTRRKGIEDRELLDAYRSFRSPIKVESIGYAKIDSGATFFMRGTFFGIESDAHEFRVEGTDSAIAALEYAAKTHLLNLELVDYSSHAVGSGIHAHSQSTVKVRLGDQQFEGAAHDSDIEKSALLAFINAINTAYVETHCRI